MKNTINNADGTEANIKLDFKYQLGTDEDADRVKNNDIRNGDNLIELENNDHRSASGGYTKEIYAKEKNPIIGK